MTKKNPYDIVKHIHTTEKSVMLQGLKNAKSNRCIARCESPKYVFVVDKDANKHEIAQAIQEIYKERNVRVTAVNTINLKGKPRRVRGFLGKTASIKKAIVTLEPGDSLDNV